MAIKNLTNAELDTIDNAASVLLELMRDATDKLNKLRVEKLTDPAARAKLFAIYARETSNLVVFLLNQAQIQEQRAEIERLREQT